MAPQEVFCWWFFSAFLRTPGSLFVSAMWAQSAWDHQVQTLPIPESLGSQSAQTRDIGRLEEPSNREGCQSKSRCEAASLAGCMAKILNFQNSLPPLHPLNSQCPDLWSLLFLLSHRPPIPFPPPLWAHPSALPRPLTPSVSRYLALPCLLPALPQSTST